MLIFYRTCRAKVRNMNIPLNIHLKENSGKESFVGWAVFLDESPQTTEGGPAPPVFEDPHGTIVKS